VNRSLLAAELPPVDACPSPDCHPGIPDACLPAGPPEEVPGGVLYPYQCAACGMTWQTLFDAFGWTVERTTAPVAEAREAA